jgi:hypothetical protein
MLAFKDTLETLLLFENAKRHRDGRKDATTMFVVDKDTVNIKHTDNGSATPAWPAVACYLIAKCLNEKNESKEQGQQASTQNEEATTPPSATEDDIKQDAASASSSVRSSAEDDIKQDAASASSSARSSADTSEARD